MSSEEVAVRVSEITEEARASLIPLFTSEGRGRGFSPAGSAMLIERSDGAKLVVTAGHVLDNLGGLPLLARGGKATDLIKLPYDNALTSQPARPSRKDDRVDLAAFHLPHELVTKLLTTGARFLAERRIRLDWDKKGVYFALGFPHRVNKVKRRRASADAQPSRSRKPDPYVIPNVAVLAPCEAAPDERYAEVKADLELNFVLIFRHSEERDMIEKPYPHPRGMSGGGIFRIGTNDALVKAHEIELAGIGTEYHEKSGLIVAASAPAVRRIVSEISDPDA